MAKVREAIKAATREIDRQRESETIRIGLGIELHSQLFEQTIRFHAFSQSHAHGDTAEIETMQRNANAVENDEK